MGASHRQVWLFVGLWLLTSASLWWYAQATATVQLLLSPLPPGVNPCVSLTSGTVAVNVFGYVTAPDGSTTITFAVKNNGKQDISHVAFSTLTWTRLEPTNNLTYTASLGKYTAVWTNSNGNPGFPSVKYTPLFSGYSQGKQETFALRVNGFNPNATLTVQSKAGQTVVAVTFNLAKAACNFTPTPTPPFSPLPTPTPTPQGGVVLPTQPQVAQCVFAPPAGALPPQAPLIPLSAYSFAAPQVIVTNTAPIGIQQWLPDNKTLLLIRYGKKGNSTELVNVETGIRTFLIGPDQSFKTPRWLTQDNTLVWSAIGTPARAQGYWVHAFDPPGERRLAADWGNSLDISPNGKEFIFLAPPAGTQPLNWNQEAKTLHALPFDLANWRYKKGASYPFQAFNVNWQPSGQKLLFWDGTWMFLYDLAKNSGCEINIQTLSPRFPTIYEALWSPNGRYLLMQIAEAPLLISHYGPFNRVLILDTYTGTAVQYALATSVAHFAWAPDNQTVVMDGETGHQIEGFSSTGYYLLNIRSGEFQRILPTLESLGGVGEWVRWSADGNRLAFQCQDSLPRGFESGAYLDRVCISQVILNK